MNMQQQIDKLLTAFTIQNNIVWRSQQREIVENICDEVIKGTSDIILDAPTGTGKSLIAMAASRVLRDLDKTGYLLVSDLELQNQYEEDLLLKYRTSIPSIRGSDNYICDDNDQRVPLGTCNLKKYNKRLMSCYSTCGYYSDRNRAIESKFSLLNYSYWLVQMNYVNLRQGVNAFSPRDVCFLDEAHKLDIIIHNHFAPRLNSSLVSSISNVENLINDKSSVHVQHLINSIKRTGSSSETLKLIEDLKDVLLGVTLSIKGYLDKHKFGSTPTAQEIQNLNSFDRIKDVYCKVQDFQELVVEDDKLMTKTIDDNEVQLNYLDSQRMLSVFFQRYTKQRVFMSATWGNIKKSSNFLGISSYKHFKVDNNFDWSSSKYQVIGKHSLTWKDRDANLLKAIKDLDDILEKYPNKKGLIHTGSYNFSDAILTHSKFKERFNQYRSSEEKRRSLLQHKQTEDSIIIGPSLLEGINLPDDQCDFIIFFKCPYLGLGSDFINRKAQLYPEWYNWKTSLSIEQGSGRGMRHKDDKCDVWFIDASFVKFFHQNSTYMSSEFLDRVLDPLDKMLLS